MNKILKSIKPAVKLIVSEYKIALRNICNKIADFLSRPVRKYENTIDKNKAKLV